MKSDTNPSMIFGLYTKPDKYELLLRRLKEKGLAVREIKFIDVELPLDDEKYNDTINFFKEFVMCDYWASRSPLNKLQNNMFGRKILEGFEKGTGYHKVNFKERDWQHRQKHELLWCLAVPLFVQDQSYWCETPRERVNMERAKEFKSDGYKSDAEILKEEIDSKYDEEAKDLPEE